MAVPTQLRGLTLPVIAAPLFIVSGHELVAAACRAGVVGTFPSLNARTPADFAARLIRIKTDLAASSGAGATVAPYGVNIVCHRTNQRLGPDMDLVVEHQVPLIITSVGDPRPIVDRVRPYGGLVFSDVTNVKWARKAAAADVDGLILVCGGAGGHAGIMNPFALVPEVRAFFPGTIVLAGAISDGQAIRAAEVLGADMVYIGTRFVATAEANAPERYKRMLIDGDAGDIIYTDAFSGVPANMLKPSIRQFGLDPDNLPAKKALDVSKEMNVDVKAWRDIWTAGHGIGCIRDAPSVAELVARFRAEYAAALARPSWAPLRPELRPAGVPAQSS